MIRPVRRPAHSYYVRDAAQADLPAVLTMKAAAWREAYGHLRDEAFFERAEATLDRQIELWRGLVSRGTTVWMAEDGRGNCVGMACAAAARPERQRGRTDLPDLELTSLYVLASAQGTRVADTLMERAVGQAPSFLWVLADNSRAHAFYRRHGFHDDGPPAAMDGPWEGLQEQLMMRPG